MTPVLTGPARLEFPALGTSALLLVTDPALLDQAAEELRGELAGIDRTCSRFRADSEISEVHRNAGTAMPVSELLGEALEAALRAAELTGGLVDPTVGAAVAALGYDRDFSLVRSSASASASPGGRRPAPGWWRVRWDPHRREVLVPRGVWLDLGAAAKALAADRAAHRAAGVTGCGVLVSLGGDISLAGEPPEGGWRVAIADDHRAALAHPDQWIDLSTGGLATSSTVARSWSQGDVRRHHIVDPRTGDNPPPVWRTVTVAAGNCLDANTASTAAIVLGARAPGWLEQLNLPARLVGPQGAVVRTAGWPALVERT